MIVKIRFITAFVVSGLIYFFTPNKTFAQNKDLNKYGLLVIKNVKALRATVKDHPEKEMVDIKKIIPNILLDLRYTTSYNFMNKILYESTTTTYLRMPAATALHQIQKELSEKNLGLKIFDAYRPYSVTEAMWEPIKDVRYVADPKKGSGHNRGIAVDVTIINLQTKEELPMGTGFDNFSDTAHQTFTALPQEILQNRILLKSLMEKYGFASLETEWWHYSLLNATDYELLDVSFKQLRKLKK